MLRLSSIGMRYLINAEVKDILKKCAEKNHHSGGYDETNKIMDTGCTI